MSASSLCALVLEPCVLRRARSLACAGLPRTYLRYCRDTSLIDNIAISSPVCASDPLQMGRAYSRCCRYFVLSQPDRRTRAASCRRASGPVRTLRAMKIRKSLARLGIARRLPVSPTAGLPELSGTTPTAVDVPSTEARGKKYTTIAGWPVCACQGVLSSPAACASSASRWKFNVLALECGSPCQRGRYDPASGEQLPITPR